MSKGREDLAKKKSFVQKTSAPSTAPKGTPSAPETLFHTRCQRRWVWGRRECSFVPSRLPGRVQKRPLRLSSRTSSWPRARTQ